MYMHKYTIVCKYTIYTYNIHMWYRCIHVILFLQMDSYISTIFTSKKSRFSVLSLRTLLICGCIILQLPAPWLKNGEGVKG